MKSKSLFLLGTALCSLFTDVNPAFLQGTVFPTSVPARPGHTQHLTSPDQTPQGVTAPEWSSIRQQYEQHRHAAFPVNGGYHARNPRQQWLTRFERGGFTTHPDSGAWQWGLELRSYGFAGHERAVTGQPRVSAEGQCVSYDWDNTLQEWFVNDQRGLEHGFTIKHRPTGASSLNSQPSTLNFLLAVRGGLRPEVEADGRGVRFVDAEGAAALTYGELTVCDANGRTFPARFEAVAQGLPEQQPGLRLVIEEQGARYPLTIDPIAQQAYLKHSNANTADADDHFGISVAVSGDTAVVGAFAEDSNAIGVNGNQSDNSATNSGAAYVFVRDGSGHWSQQAYLKASNTGEGDAFGYSVAVSEDTVVVGAFGEDSGGIGVNSIFQSDNSAGSSGAAYVFVRSGTTWSQQAYLKASNTGEGDAFGWSVAVSADTVVVGAPYEGSDATGVNGNQSNNSAAYSGAAYIFARDGSGQWSQQAYLKASNTGEGDAFGWSVAVSGVRVVVGAYGEASSASGINGNQSDNSAGASGAAYVFVRLGRTTWSQQAYLKASNTGVTDFFGYSVAVSGDSVVVGAYGEDSNAAGVNGDQNNNIAFDSGAAYVFVRNGGAWSQQAYLKASNTSASDSFGFSVAVSGDTVLVGAREEDSSATGVNGNQSDNSASGSGAACVFLRSGTNWSQQAYLKASNTGAYDFFGRSVAVSGDTVLVGALFEGSNATGVNGNQSDNSAEKSGAAYIFARSGATWNQEAYLKASNLGAETGDAFGWSVAVSADIVVVGAPDEDSNATGINGDQSDNSAERSGAAYIFARDSSGHWSQQAYLKASNTGEGDHFGYSVAVSGETAVSTVVVGAHEEASNARGVNGNQSDNSAFRSGAAYVFVRSGTTWSQQAYLKASNTEGSDEFGVSVAVSAGTVVVGASLEASNARGVNGNQSDNSAGGSGAAYVFVRTGSTWSQQAYLKASNTGASDFFGDSVTVSGDTVLVGAYGEDSSTTGINGNQSDNSAGDSGAAYVFVRGGTTWSQQAYLKASNTGASDFFGGSVAVSGNTMVVGASGEDSSATGVNGNQSDNTATSSGAAYVFVRTGSTWSQQAYLKASNTGASDFFGGSVAVSGDTVVVGAAREDSFATGVNSVLESNNSATDSGAAYVFARSGSTWSQRAYLKASNTGPTDFFGYSVAVSSNTMVVGASGEDSNAAGLNGDQNNNIASNSGAAYVFTVLGPQLTIVRSELTKVVLSWRTNEPGFTLQRATYLNPPAPWIDSTDAPAIVGPEFRVTNNITGSRQFFRLRGPPPN